MALDALRRQLLSALADPRRRQLAHVAILDVSMAAGGALERHGLPRAVVEEATEAIAAYLRGEADTLPAAGGAAGEPPVDLEGIAGEALDRISREPSFGPIFGASR